MFSRKRSTKEDFKRAIIQIKDALEGDFKPEALRDSLIRALRGVSGRARRKGAALRGCLNSIDIKQAQQRRLDKMIEIELNRAKRLIIDIERDMKLDDAVTREISREEKEKEEKEERDGDDKANRKR